MSVNTQKLILHEIVTSIRGHSSIRTNVKYMEESQIYAQKTLEFITIASEFCKALEHCREFEQHEFIDVMRNLLPMVYLKVSLIGTIEEADGYNEPKVVKSRQLYEEKNSKGFATQYYAATAEDLDEALVYNNSIP